MSKQKNSNKCKSVFTWLGIYGLVFAIVLVASLFGVRAIENKYRYYPVSGTSMQPTINPDIHYGTEEDRSQDGVFVEVTKDVKYNDIVIIQRRPTDEHTIIKRVIATGGDMVSIFVNDSGIFGEGADEMFHTFVVRAGQSEVQMLQEDFVAANDKQNWTSSATKRHTNSLNSSANIQYEDKFFDTFFTNAENLQKIYTVEVQNGVYALFYKLDADEVFYLGDHREVSADARSNGTTRRANIVGKVISIIHNAKELDDRGLLWWVQITTLLSCYWSNIEDFYAWN